MDNYSQADRCPPSLFSVSYGDSERYKEYKEKIKNMFGITVWEIDPGDMSMSETLEYVEKIRYKFKEGIPLTEGETFTIRRR